MLFVKESIIAASPECVFAFHESPDAFARLMPPWEKSRIIQAAPDLKPGARAVVETKLFGMWPVRWEALHTVYDPPRMFEDIQTRGPFRSWRHRHIITPHEDKTALRDEIEYEPPMGFLGRWLAPWLIIPRLEKLFDYRHEVTKRGAEEQDVGDST
jgi:ligand-binding SRPBCC domain-containing protein